MIKSHTKTSVSQSHSDCTDTAAADDHKQHNDTIYETICLFDIFVKQQAE